MESSRAWRQSIAYLLPVFFLFSFSLQAFQVAFLKLKQRNGDPILLEPGVPYSHVAISFGDAWLHASPRKGVVELSWSLESIGEVHAILSNSREPELELLQILPVLGLPYDQDYDWDTGDRLYCSELVAKLLEIPPQPMAFDPGLWPERFLEKNGKPGLSPSDLFKELQKMGYNEEFVESSAATCELASSAQT